MSVHPLYFQIQAHKHNYGQKKIDCGMIKIVDEYIYTVKASRNESYVHKSYLFDLFLAF